MVKKYVFYVGQRPKYTRTKDGAFAQLEIDNGTFCADLGASFESRALPRTYSDPDVFEKTNYEVLETIENVYYGDAIP